MTIAGPSDARSNLSGDREEVRELSISEYELVTGGDGGGDGGAGNTGGTLTDGPSGGGGSGPSNGDNGGGGSGHVLISTTV